MVFSKPFTEECQYCILKPHLKHSNINKTTYSTGWQKNVNFLLYQSSSRTCKHTRQGKLIQRASCNPMDNKKKTERSGEFLLFFRQAKMWSK